MNSLNEQISSLMLDHLLPTACSNSQDESQFLFQPQQSTNTLHMFNLKTRVKIAHSLDFTIPSGVGFCHAWDCLYMGGGQYNIKDFRRINSLGCVSQLDKLPTGKLYFPLSLWKEHEVIFSLGGYVSTGNKNLKEVQEFSLAQNSWKKKIPDLPDAVRCSAATVLNDTLYNIGGIGASQSIYYIDLREATQWETMNLPNCDFKGSYGGDATVLFNHIVVFGSHFKNQTLVFGQREGEKQLVGSLHDGLNYMRVGSDSSFATLNNELFAFAQNKYNEVYRFNMLTGTWSIFS